MHYQLITLLTPILRPQVYLDPGSGSFLIRAYWKKIKPCSAVQNRNWSAALVNVRHFYTLILIVITQWSDLDFRSPIDALLAAQQLVIHHIPA